MKWADAKAANSWTHASKVTEALTKLFYRTHTKQGTVRKRPFNEDEDELLFTTIGELF